ncbi:MAG: YaaL family protein [Lachnospiraceae bacterium]|nr:YaaL family protein [Lachnospiraceae bacterium]
MMTDKYFQEISREQLISDLKQTKTALDDAYSNFEQVVDPDLVDSYIYQVNAVQKRYHFLLKQVQMLDLQNAIEGELAVL